MKKKRSQGHMSDVLSTMRPTIEVFAQSFPIQFTSPMAGSRHLFDVDLICDSKSAISVKFLAEGWLTHESFD
jgi:hypothetical protein